MINREAEQLILIIEDNLDDEALILLALRRARVDQGILVIRDGADAVDYLLGNGQRHLELEWELPQVVFLDYKLPRLNGLQVLERIRSHGATRTLPVVFMSSAQEEDLADKCSALGADALVHKSLQFSEFTSAIQNQVEHFVH